VLRFVGSSVGPSFKQRHRNAVVILPVLALTRRKVLNYQAIRLEGQKMSGRETHYHVYLRVKASRASDSIVPVTSLRSEWNEGFKTIPIRIGFFAVVFAGNIVVGLAA